MWFFKKARYQPQLIEILSSAEAPINLDQVVHQLFQRQERLSDLLVLTRGAIKRKQRLKRRIQIELEAGIATKSRFNGEWRYTLNSGSRVS